MKIEHINKTFDLLEEAMERPALELPPDPEGMNEERAQWAHGCISFFQCQTGTDWNDCVKDFLCNLMHFCDRNTLEDGETKFDFDAALEKARMHYRAETAQTEELQ